MTVAGDVRRPRARRWLWFALEAMLIVAMVYGVQLYQRRGLPAGAAPALVARQVDGQRVSLAEMRGTPVLVHFWMSECPVCRFEEQSVAAVARDHQVVTVAMHSGDDGEVGRYLTERGLGFPVVNDPDGLIAAAWGIRGVPASFVIDPAGQILFTEVGYTSELGLRARLWLAR